MNTATQQAPARSDFRFLDRLRVRWAEIDAQKIVFNGHYLMYVDTAVAGYWRALAMPYAQTMESLQGDMYVRKASLEYLASARYDDVLDVGVKCSRVGTSSMVFTAAVFRQNELLVSGELIYVFADPHTQTSRPVPQRLRDVFDAFECGQAMVDVRLGSWTELKADAQPLRTAVFVVEQKVPADLEYDEADGDAVHAVAYNRFEQALATGRLLEHAPGVARIGRMAVDATMRSNGVGRQVLDALVSAAESRFDSVLLHAQIAAADFYRRAGFVAQGAVFEEAGIAHIEMVKHLKA
jgi:YbgC/YbaW family acyl-CoA thioester hydrolase